MQPTISGSDLEGFAFVPDAVSVERSSASAFVPDVSVERPSAVVSKL